MGYAPTALSYFYIREINLVVNKITPNEFEKRIAKLYGLEYKIVLPYINNITAVKIMHTLCNGITEIKPTTLYKGKFTCTDCNKVNDTRKESFFTKFQNKFKEEVIIISDYVNCKTKIKVQHVQCGYKWETSPDTLINVAKGCPKCSGNIKNKTTESYKKEIFDKYGNDYKVIGKYKNINTKIRVIHKCGYEFDAPPSGLLGRPICAKCNGKYIRSEEEFLIEASEILGTEYIIKGKYIDTKTPIDIFHKKCGKIWSTVPSYFLYSNGRCTCRRFSGGEDKVEEILKLNNLNHVKQFKFDDCISIRPLPFDFAVFNSNGKIKFMIEYDGRHHFEPIDYFGGEDYYQSVLERDEIKNRYCLDNNILLLRIPYWDFKNIETIIANFIERNKEKEKSYE